MRKCDQLARRKAAVLLENVLNHLHVGLNNIVKRDWLMGPGRIVQELSGFGYPAITVLFEGIEHRPDDGTELPSLEMVSNQTLLSDCERGCVNEKK
jgi:hypothetical protein